MKKNKNIIDLLIDLEKVNKQLEIIKDPESGYIDKKVNEIWGNDKKGLNEAQKQELNDILSML